jgi:hypothetical protein
MRCRERRNKTSLWSKLMCQHELVSWMKTGYNSLDNGCKRQQQREVQDVVTDMCKQTSGM